MYTKLIAHTETENKYQESVAFMVQVAGDFEILMDSILELTPQESLSSLFRNIAVDKLLLSYSRKHSIDPNILLHCTDIAHILSKEDPEDHDPIFFSIAKFSLQQLIPKMNRKEAALYIYLLIKIDASPFRKATEVQDDPSFKKFYTDNIPVFDYSNTPGKNNSYYEFLLEHLLRIIGFDV